MDIVSNSPHKKELSRRDFLKAATIGTVATLVGLKSYEVATDRKFINGIKVLKELSKAEKSKDEVQITEARKLAVVWMFAESSILFGAEAGHGRSAQAMEHFLYGEGEEINIDPWLLERSKSDSFWEALINQGFAKYSEDLNHEGANMSGKIMKGFIQELKKGYTFGCNPGIAGSDDQIDLFYAFGRSTYTIKAEDVELNTQDGLQTLTMSDIGLKLSDKYDWDRDFSVGLGKKSKRFVSEVISRNMDWFIHSEDKVRQMLRTIGLSEKEGDTLDGIYKSAIQNIESFPDKISEETLKVEKWATGEEGREIEEIDLALLKKLGAMDYNIKASIHIDSKIEIYV